MRELNDLMQFGHVIRVHSDGSITEPRGIYGPEEMYMETLDDDAGSIMQSHEDAYAAEVERQGWQLMRGYSGAYLAGRTYIMHPSEYVGGGMEQDIRENPGLYVAITIETLDDSGDAAGWAVAYREEQQP